MRVRPRVILTIVILVAAVILAHRWFNPADGRVLDQSGFYDAVTQGRVIDLTMVPDDIGFQIRGTLNPGHAGSGERSIEKFTAYVLADRDLPGILREQGVRVTAEPPRRGFSFFTIGLWIFLVVSVAVVAFLMFRMRRGAGGVLSLRRSRARLSSHANRITFKDVAGVEEAKQELQEIIEFLDEPDRFQKLGGRAPTGVLLTGPPGTGKTLLARAVAGEAGVPFYSVSGADFVEMYIGIGASRVRDLFKQARQNAPCIVFIDEVDAVGRMRGTGVGGGHDEREQTLNQLLVELDGFAGNDGVIVIAATNRPDVLDPALLRPGRFDRQVVIERPDLRGREQILTIHARKLALNEDVELGLIARGTPGFSAAELANLVNEAALRAAGRRQETVTRDDFEHARDKGLMGSERRSLVFSDEDKRAMACQQAGHALLAQLLPEADPLHKVTIIPRGQALGSTQQLPIDDRHTASRPDLLARICGLMGGRVAEELQMNRRSSGAGESFERATSLARRMVTEWGMSATLGPLAYGKPSGAVFLGKEIAQHRDYSEATATEIDSEVRKIVMDCYDEARRILGGRIETLAAIADALLARETLAADQVATLVRGEALQPVAEPGAGRCTEPPVGPVEGGNSPSSLALRLLGRPSVVMPSVPGA